MKKLDLEQRSPQWHEKRKTTIGASDSAAIMGISPYKNAYRVWQEKRQGLQTPVNAAMQAGIDFESVAVGWVEDMTGLMFLPAVVQHEELPFLIASLDGLDWNDEFLLETKVSPYCYEKAINGIIDPWYMCQVQHQLLCTGLKRALFCAYHKEKGHGKIIEVEADEIFHARIVEECGQFWFDYIREESALVPSPDKSDHVNVTVGQQQERVIREYLDIARLRKGLDEREKNLRALICEWTDDGNICFVDNENVPLLKATRVEKAGAVDYEKLCLAEGITEEKKGRFRKESIGYYRLSEVNNAL